MNAKINEAEKVTVNRDALQREHGDLSSRVISLREAEDRARGWIKRSQFKEQRFAAQNRIDEIETILSAPASDSALPRSKVELAVTGTGFLCFDGQPKLAVGIFRDGNLNLVGSDIGDSFCYAPDSAEWSFRFGETKTSDFDFEYSLEVTLLPGNAEDGADDRWTLAERAMQSSTWLDLLAANPLDLAPMEMLPFVVCEGWHPFNAPPANLSGDSLCRVLFERDAGELSALQIGYGQGDWHSHASSSDRIGELRGLLIDSGGLLKQVSGWKFRPCDQRPDWAVLDATKRPGGGKEYLIFSQSEAEATTIREGFWSNINGWGDFSDATRFTASEKVGFTLPLAARGDATWADADELAPFFKEAEMRANGNVRSAESAHRYQEGMQVVDFAGQIIGRLISVTRVDGRFWANVVETCEVDLSGSAEILDLTGLERARNPNLEASYLRIAEGAQRNPPKVNAAQTLWDRDDIQFPRLLAEITATQNLDMSALADSMDITIEQANSLFDRADQAWESIKSKTAPVQLR